MRIIKLVTKPHLRSIEFNGEEIFHPKPLTTWGVKRNRVYDILLYSDCLICKEKHHINRIKNNLCPSCYGDSKSGLL